MESYATSEKVRHEPKNARFKIYRRCDEQARDILDEARSEGQLDLNGDDKEDHLRKKLVDKIISLIGTKTIPKKTNRKPAILNDI